MTWATVAALVRGPLPERQEFFVCAEPECAVVYFGDGGRELRAHDVRAVPGFKLRGSDLACFCLLEPLAKISQELSELGTSPTLVSIRARVGAGECACEVRNPTGRCCLPEIRDRLEGASARGVDR